MKKKILSIMLATVMLLSMVPLAMLTAYAEQIECPDCHGVCWVYEECPTCDGTGKCPDCHGDGCDNCDGGYCPECGGSCEIEVECDRCEGEGYIDVEEECEHEECPDCHGDCWLPKTCPTCDGTGECPDCHGDGCDNCDGGYCPECGGSGEIEAECETCNGNGYIEVKDDGGYKVPIENSKICIYLGLYSIQYDYFPDYMSYNNLYLLLESDFNTWHNTDNTLEALQEASIVSATAGDKGDGDLWACFEYGETEDGNFTKLPIKGDNIVWPVDPDQETSYTLVAAGATGYYYVTEESYFEENDDEKTFDYNVSITTDAHSPTSFGSASGGHTHDAGTTVMTNGKAHWFACKEDDCDLKTVADYESAFASDATLKTTLGYKETVDVGGLMGRQGLMQGETVSKTVGRTVIGLTQAQLDSIEEAVVIQGNDGEKNVEITLDCAYTYFYNRKADGSVEKIEAEDFKNKDGEQIVAFLIFDNDGKDGTISGYGYYRLYDSVTNNFLFDVLYDKPKK